MTAAPLPAVSPDSGDKPLGYMPQLDGLRTIAVTAVVVQHYKLLIGYGGYGVHLFFVLSGFLITGILLSERTNVERGGISVFHAFRQFYIRRSLRIFPLYYFVVFSGILLNVSYAREYAPWLLTYTINFKMAAQGWAIGNFAHLWSLAVEEQYYLVWPWLILLVPRRWLVPSAIAAIVVAPLFRATLAMWFTNEMNNTGWLAGYFVTPTALDSLGMGSLVAILNASEKGAAWLRNSMRRVIPLVGLIALLLFRFAPHVAQFILVDTAAAIFFAWLIYTAARGFGGIAGKLLSAVPIVYLGRISYGIYVYHQLVPPVVNRIASRLGLAMPENVWLYSLTYGSATVAAATVSWYVLERPMNQLKRKFPYRAAEDSVAAPVVAIT
ncbi:MAG TPA: acyltransferase [Gemmatimonadaceae bacterium]|nr:acyltransferase [Gemmatimonadaceae bacterium]